MALLEVDLSMIRHPLILIIGLVVTLASGVATWRWAKNDGFLQFPIDFWLPGVLVGIILTYSSFH